MDLHEFREKVRELHEKSLMKAGGDWPFVYDEDEIGTILIKNGQFFFWSKAADWEESPLCLENVSRLRYARDYGCDEIDGEEDEIAYSTIKMDFNDNSFVTVVKNHCYEIMEVSVYLKASEEDIKRLEEKCATVHVSFGLAK